MRTEKALYHDAVNWLAENDDNTEIQQGEGWPTVAAAIIRDVFLVSESKLRRDILNEIDRINRKIIAG
jgi:hypothetical protein